MSLNYMVGLLNRVLKSDFYENSSRLIRFLRKKLNIRPGSYPFVSGDSFRFMADIVYEGEDSNFKFVKVNAGDVIFCETHHLEMFIKNILPEISQPFILITHNSDTNVENASKSLLESKYLHHWYAQNCFVRHHKLTNIPIGLENAWLSINGIKKDFVRLRKLRVEKYPKILWGFNLNTNVAERTLAKKYLQKNSIAEERWLPPRKYRQALNQYMFVASPPGNGVDCHRTWEALYLGVIPIVVNSTFWDGFGGFPGLILESWSELEGLTSEKLTKIYTEKIRVLQKADFIWMNYWQKEIHKSIDEAKSINNFRDELN